MKKMNVHYTSDPASGDFFESLAIADRQSLDYVLWTKPVQTPQVSFSILYNEKCIYLRYFVRESERRATVQKTNGAVWEDSCVEFFISLDNRMSYFNFEFNSLGTKLGAFGTTRTRRRSLPVLVVETITTKVELVTIAPGNFEWNLFVAIPLSVFQQPAGFSLTGKRVHANFYKCGDGLKDLHFLSWSDLNNAEPDFHRPEYFGELFFSS
jgi:hypothetical protein